MGKQYIESFIAFGTRDNICQTSFQMPSNILIEGHTGFFIIEGDKPAIVREDDPWVGF